MSQSILFEDIFTVNGLNLAGKKFERGDIDCHRFPFDLISISLLSLSC